METRNNLIRILSGFGWLILFYFITNFLIGGIVGAIAGASTDSSEAGAIAGQEASIEFFQNHGFLIIIGQLSAFTLLAFTGKLPGTTRYKKDKNT